MIMSGNKMAGKDGKAAMHFRIWDTHAGFHWRDGFWSTCQTGR